MLAGCCCGAAAWTATRALGDEIGALQIVCLRALVGLSILLPFILRAGLWKTFQTPNPILQMFRMALLAGSITCFALAVVKAP